MQSKLIISLIGLLSSVVYLLPAQSVYRVDTLPSAVPQTHQYLHIQVPVGEMLLRSSGECGISLARLKAPDSTIRHRIQQQVDQSGNHHRSLAVASPELTPKSANITAEASQTMRLGANFSSLDRLGHPHSSHSEYHLDPNLSTDLNMDLGVGASRLDFSGLSLRNAVIRSAFADVMIAYRTPNQIDMQQMDLHVTKGDVILKRPEMARAQLISIQNDMGDTKIVLGDDYLPATTISVHAGVGGCTLIVHANHPTKVLIKGGLFSDQEVGGSFREVEKGTYTNEAYSNHCKSGSNGCQHATRIICDLDLGSVSVMEMK